MSRVERHKNEYSKADRAAVENIRPSEDPADISFAYGKNGNNAAGETSGKTGGADVEVQRKGRAARRKAEAQNAEMGILDQTDEQKARSRKEARAMGDGKPELHINRFFGWLIRFIGTIILIVAIVAGIALFAPRYAGIEQYPVDNESMEPAISEGSMVYTAQIEPATLSEGDIVVFVSKENGDTPVAHRVVENHIAEGVIITKGDANAQNDPAPVAYSDILGKKMLCVPMLGYLAAPMNTLMGKIALGLVTFGALLLMIIGGRIRKG